MDMSFANQALCSEWMAQNAKSLTNKVYAVPVEIGVLGNGDFEVAIALYDSATGGPLPLAEARTVRDTNGLLSTTLGSSVAYVSRFLAALLNMASGGKVRRDGANIGANRDHHPQSFAFIAFGRR